MALSQRIEVSDAVPQRNSERPAPRHNVIPFPAPRVLLPVALPCDTPDQSRAQLRSLLHSPLGVYVVHTEVVRDELRVRFDIALEDLDFTMHTLINTLSDATIGPIKRRSAAAAGAR